MVDFRHGRFWNVPKEYNRTFLHHAEIDHLRGPGGRPGASDSGPKIVDFRMVPKMSILLFGYLSKSTVVEIGNCWTSTFEPPKNITY